jgi:hypothetical protein
MSSPIELAGEVLKELTRNKLISPALKLHGNTLRLEGAGQLEIPTGSAWRRTVNASLLPRSISAESRQHLLYAVLQDFVRKELLLHHGANNSRPLTQYKELLGAFEDVYRMPPEGPKGKDILFPIHVSVPMVFDTYRRLVAPEGPDAGDEGRRSQTDKGFRGPFIEFFCCDSTGCVLDDHLLRVLRNLFAKTDGLTPLDHELVASLRQQIMSEKKTQLEKVVGKSGLEQDWWDKVYKELPTKSEYRPLPEFELQGEELAKDVQAIAHTAGLSRIERVAFVERLLFYHFGLYMVRLTRNLYNELARACRRLHADPTQPEGNPWANRDLVVRYHARSDRLSGIPQAEYQAMMSALNEAYLLLPVLNNLERAIRAVGGETVRAADQLRWADVRSSLDSLDDQKRKRVAEVLTFLCEFGRREEQLEPTRPDSLRAAPLNALFDALRLYYSQPDNRRYPRDHHQTVFEAIVRSGPESFVTSLPAKHFVLGDELLYLLVLTLFEHHEDNEREDSTFAPRTRGELRHQRLPLKVLEKRLEKDLLLPANEEAKESLRTSLTRLGLLERLSDVGEANFLRHPTGI